MEFNVYRVSFSCFPRCQHAHKHLKQLSDRYDHLTKEGLPGVYLPVSTHTTCRINKDKPEFHLYLQTSDKESVLEIKKVLKRNEELSYIETVKCENVKELVRTNEYLKETHLIMIINGTVNIDDIPQDDNVKIIIATENLKDCDKAVDLENVHISLMEHISDQVSDLMEQNIFKAFEMKIKCDHLLSVLNGITKVDAGKEKSKIFDDGEPKSQFNNKHSSRQRSRSAGYIIRGDLAITKLDLLQGRATTAEISSKLEEEYTVMKKLRTDTGKSFKKENELQNENNTNGSKETFQKDIPDLEIRKLDLLHGRATTAEISSKLEEEQTVKKKLRTDTSKSFKKESELQNENSTNGSKETFRKDVLDLEIIKLDLLQGRATTAEISSKLEEEHTVMKKLRTDASKSFKKENELQNENNTNGSKETFQKDIPDLEIRKLDLLQGRVTTAEISSKLEEEQTVKKKLRTDTSKSFKKESELQNENSTNGSKETFRKDILDLEIIKLDLLQGRATTAEISSKLEEEHTVKKKFRTDTSKSFKEEIELQNENSTNGSKETFRKDILEHIERIERLYDEIKGMITRSRVPKHEQPQYDKQFDGTVSNELKEDLRQLSSSIRSCGYRCRSFVVFVDDKCNPESLNPDLERIMKKHNISMFTIVPSSVKQFSSCNVGSKIAAEFGKDTIKFGTLGGFGHSSSAKESTTIGLVSRHVVTVGNIPASILRVGSEGQPIEASVLVDNSFSDRENVLDIAAASFGHIKDRLDTDYKTSEQMAAKGRLSDYSPEEMKGLHVHIHGSTTPMGYGTVTMPKIEAIRDKDMDGNFIIIEDRESPGTEKIAFCKEGDSGAIVCADDQENPEEVKLISMIMGENTKKPGSYFSLNLEKGLYQVEEETKSNIKLL